MVLLSAGRWRDHILRRHRQDMEGRYEDTIQAIAGPALITRSPRSSAIELYYGEEPPQLRIVVLFRHQLEGEVVTAYPTVGREKGERVLWRP